MSCGCFTLILPAGAESGIDAVRQAMLSSGVRQPSLARSGGDGLADRFDPRQVFVLCAMPLRRACR
jgi:hypothetical protein